MKTQIYVMTHKAFDVPFDPMYVPMFVGRKEWVKLNKDLTSHPLLEYAGDDAGDNISDQNCYFSELTGLYWVWKNVRDADIVGVCHYRRYLLNERGYMFTGAEIADVLAECDIITTKELKLNFSYYEGFGSHHKISYLEETRAVIAERFPEYLADFERLVHEKHTYFGNMLICKKALYDAYCAWLFGILFEVQRRVVVEEEDSYHRRIFGFISEFLLYVWVRHNRLRVCECMVGMLGEKAEVGEVKRGLAGFFERGDYEGAKAYFLEAKRKRPDLLMEASDITGELHLCMEVIAIAGLEQQAYGHNILNRISGFGELMVYCNRLNAYALERILGMEVEPALERWAKDEHVSDVALHAAEAVAGSLRPGPFKGGQRGDGFLKTKTI